MSTYDKVVDAVVEHAGDSAAIVTGKAKYGAARWFTPDRGTAFPTKQATAAFFSVAREPEEKIYQEFYDDLLEMNTANATNPPVKSRVGTMAEARYKIDFLMSVQKAFVLRRQPRIAAMAASVNVKVAEKYRIFPRILTKKLEQIKKETAQEFVLKGTEPFVPLGDANEVIPLGR